MCGSIVAIALIIYYTAVVRSQFYHCHDDSSVTPLEGTAGERQFTWLGVLQYIHIKTGHPHYFRSPRVVLISRQFAMSTANDAATVPQNYALGNVALANYERDEDECKTTIRDMEEGVECESASLLMPIADVLLHPEYKHFGVKNSIALLKLVTLVKSVYMLPVCLPFKNFLFNKFGKQTRERIMHVDYVADVPRDFSEEEKEITRISLLPKELCFAYDRKLREHSKRRNLTISKRLVCSTGCGFHSGSPTIVHEHTGHWSIVAVSTGGPLCPDPLRSRRPPPPAGHITIHPYVPWITAAITGHAIGAFDKNDPFGFVMSRATMNDYLGHQWLGHWWMGGIRCFDRGDAADDMYKFYHEIFALKPVRKTYMNYYLEITAPVHTKIICVKVGLPYRYGQPRVWDLDTPVTKVAIPFLKFSQEYRFQIEGWGYNVTEISESSDYFSDEYYYESEEVLSKTKARPTEAPQTEASATASPATEPTTDDNYSGENLF